MISASSRNLALKPARSTYRAWISLTATSRWSSRSRASQTWPMPPLAYGLINSNRLPWVKLGSSALALDPKPFPRGPVTVGARVAARVAPNVNTVEIGASHSLLLPWVCRPTRHQGGYDSHATRTLHAAGRRRGPGSGSTGGTRTDDPPRGRSTSAHGHWPGQLAQLSVDARGRLVGGTGHGVVDRFADPTGLQGRPAAPQRRGVAAPLQPLRRPSAVGRGAGAAPVPPSRSPPGPAGDAGGVLRRLAVDGARRHDLRCPRLGGQRGRLRPPLGRAAREAPSLRSASSAWSSWGPMSKSRWWCGPPPMASNRCSPACSAI